MLKYRLLLKKLTYWVFVWPILLCYFLAPAPDRAKCRMDLSRYYRQHHGCEPSSTIVGLYNILLAFREFRTIYYKRIGPLSWLVKWLLPGRSECHLMIKSCDLGGGLYIQHGWAMVLNAKKVGENLWINQCVTVGYNGNEHPIIGDNVTIGCGAAVLGGITIGNNAKIGANATVVTDVPDGAIAVGPKATIISKQ